MKLRVVSFDLVSWPWTEKNYMHFDNKNNSFITREKLNNHALMQLDTTVSAAITWNSQY